MEFSVPLEQVRASPIGFYRRWMLLTCCRACGRAVQRQHVNFIADRRPDLTVGQVCDRLRCRFQPRPNQASCGAAASWVALETPDGADRVVVVGDPGPILRPEF